MKQEPFDWILACFIAMALALGSVMGCVGLGALLVLVELF